MPAPFFRVGGNHDLTGDELKDVWRNDSDDDFKSIERALAARPYTVVSGHLHSFARHQRHGREYYSLGTTGGGQNPQDQMAFDHLTVVSR